MVDMDIRWVQRSKWQYSIIADNFNPIFSESEYLTDNTIFCLEVRCRGDLAAVSMVRLNKGLKRMVLLYTFVFPHFRMMGINTKIKVSVEQFAKDSDIDHLWGHVRENNTASINSLLKSGYEIFDEGGLYYKNGDKKLTVKKVLI